MSNFVKTVLPSACGYSSGMPLASLVDVHSKGVDADWMRKAAAAGVFKDADIKPETGMAHIHLIAMGDSDAYGQNRNGDIFFKESRYVDIPHPKHGVPSRIHISKGNKETHHTFEKYAKVYLNHCFVADTQVLMADFTYRDIAAINIGDKVVSADGNICKVTRTFKHAAPTTLTQFDICGIRRPIICTEDHPLRIVRYDNTICHKIGAAARNKCFPHTEGTHSVCLTRNCDGPRRDFAAEWMPARYVRHGDFVCFPRNFQVDTCPYITDEDDAYFVGLAFAEGCFYKGDADPVTSVKTAHEFSLTFNETEKHTLVAWVLAYAAKRGLSVRGPYYHKSNHTLTIQFTDATVYTGLAALFGGKTYSHQRRLHSGVLGLPPTLRLALLGGYMDGDGSWHSSHKAVLRGRSTSFDGLEDLRRLAHSVGIPAVCNSDGRARTMLNKRSGAVYQCKPSGALAIYGHWNRALADYCRKVDIPEGGVRVAGSQFVTQDYVCSPITAIQAIPSDGYTHVHNLEVEGDNSYIVYGIGVHNCNKDPRKAEGDVVKSAHNDAMARVELIIKVPEDRWRDDIEKLASGGDVAFSMSCTVPADSCTICGNKAPNRSKYCEHVKYNMGSITKEGHEVGVINDHMRYFDISKVVVPADRIAFGLLKAASSAGVVSGSELAERLNIVAPDDLMATPATLDKLAMIRKLAEIEKEIEATAEGDSPINSCANSFDKDVFSRDMHDDDMRTLTDVSRADIPSVLGSLADAKITLSLKDFFKLVMGNKFEALAPHMGAAEDMLPGIFTHMGKGPCKAMSGMGDMELGDGMLPRKVRDVIQQLIPSSSMDAEPVQRRVTVKILRGGGPAKIIKASNHDVLMGSSDLVAERLAAVYAMYKVAYCQRVGDNEDIWTKAVLHNYC